MKLVTTKLSEKSLKTVAIVTKILPLIPKLKIIIIPLNFSATNAKCEILTLEWLF